MATYVTPGELGLSTPLGDLLGSSTAEMNAELADYAKLGVKWIRTNIWWDVAQPKNDGTFNWEPMDRAVKAASAYGIKIIGELVGTPSWVDGHFTSGYSQAAFANYAKAAAEHFGSSINYWEIRNEPNMAGVTPADYVKILKGAYAAIKGVDSSDMVISGGLSATPFTGNGLYGAADFLKGIYDNGGKDYFDAVGYHPYTYPLMPKDPSFWNGWQIMEDGIRGTMVANGNSGKQVWMTELGAPTAGGANAMTQAQQAEILQQAHDIAAGYSWAGPIMWYSYQDHGGSQYDYENWFGMITPNGEHKLVYDTYKAIANGGSASTGTVSSAITVTGQTYTGDDSANAIVGNDQNNAIYGKGGNDTITGGSGNNSLWGGDGNDTFVFGPSRSFGWDTIKDFQVGDKIDLSAIDANVNVAGDQSFTFIGNAWLSKAGDLGYYRDAAGHSSVQGDVNGDGLYDFSIRVDGWPAFTANSFVL